MKQKTRVTAEEGKPDLFITREFDLPVNLLFKAHVEPELLEEWMGTTVLKFESKKHGSYEIETKDNKGNVAFRAHGVFHDFVPDQKITRTFEMMGSPFGVQLEFMEFERLTDDTSKLTIHTVFKSLELRNQLLQYPFEPGINMAHNKLQEVVSKLK
jgi:Uncharacterized conserved protein